MSAQEAGVRVAAMVRELVEALVDRPDQVTVVMSLHGRNVVVMTVTVAERDVGRVLGRMGRTTRSLRTIVDAVSQRQGIRCELSVVGDRGAKREGSYGRTTL